MVLVLESPPDTPGVLTPKLDLYNPKRGFIELRFAS